MTNATSPATCLSQGGRHRQAQLGLLLLGSRVPLVAPVPPALEVWRETCGGGDVVSSVMQTSRLKTGIGCTWAVHGWRQALLRTHRVGGPKQPKHVTILVEMLSTF